MRRPPLFALLDVGQPPGVEGSCDRRQRLASQDLARRPANGLGLVSHDGARPAPVTRDSRHETEHPPPVRPPLGRELAHRPADADPRHLGVLGVDGRDDAAHHPASAFADLSLTLAHGVDGVDVPAPQDDEELLPLDGLAGQPALVVGDDLVHLAGAKRVEHRLPLGSLDSRVRRRQVVVDEHPDRDFAPQSARQFHAIGPLALDADLQPGWVLADAAVHRDGLGLGLGHRSRVARVGRCDETLLVGRAAGAERREHGAGPVGDDCRRRASTSDRVDGRPSSVQSNSPREISLGARSAPSGSSDLGGDLGPRPAHPATNS